MFEGNPEYTECKTCLVQSQRTPDTGAAVSKHKEFERSEKDTIEQAHHLARGL